MRFAILMFLLVGTQLVFGQRNGRNSLSGSIKIPQLERRVKKGTGYNKDGTKVMHSSDPMASIDRNIIISAHPLTFNPELDPTPNAYVTQKEQTFIPFVLPITQGSTVYFLNEDEFFHNIYSLTPGARFNIGRRPPGSPYALEIKRQGVISLSCDIHAHMNGVILSLDTPYFTRMNSRNQYQLDGLPDGEYRIEVYHPMLKKITRTIAVRSGESVNINFDFSNQKKL